ncbi:MAG: hypothetical protein WAL94_13850 [Bacteroidales bacterium]|jgi:hypothetical protein
MKKIFVIIAGILLNTSLFGQTVTEQEKAVYDPQNTLTDRPLSKPDQRPPLRERLFFGGYFGLQFGDYTNIEVSPTIGVWVLPRVAIAAGPSFQYYATPYIETTIYGGTSYVQLMLLRDLNNILPVGIHLGIYGQAEYEGQSLDNSYVSYISGSPDSEGRMYSDAFLLGAGISQPLGGRASINLSFLWALNQPEYYLYDSPEIRVSFQF